LERLLGHAIGARLGALAWNQDPRAVEMHRRAGSVSAQSALGKQPATEDVIGPTLRHLADRVASRMRKKNLAGRTVTARVRFADLRAVTRSVTLPAAISATVILAEVAEDLVATALADHPEEANISLLAIGVSHLEEDSALQLELPFELEGEARRPGTEKGAARWVLDRSVDDVREKFGRELVGYGSVALADRRSVPDEFRELAEKEL
jgi:DNA polymerase-4